MRRATIIAAAIAIAAAAVWTPSAGAAVSFSFTEAAHEASPIAPGTTNRGDQYVAYSVRLKNTGTTKAATGASVTISLPAGVEMSSGGAVVGPGWSCHRAASTCVSSEEPAAGAEFARLQIKAWLLPEAPSTIEAGFDAYGGGAALDAFAVDSLTLGPETLFGLSSSSAGACSAPSAGEPLVRSCKEAEEHGATPYAAAGGHPFAASAAFSLTKHLTANGEIMDVQNLRELFTELPAGFIGNPEALHPLCTVAEVRESKASEPLCPESAAVGGVRPILPGFGENMLLYRVAPEDGYVAAFAFRAAELAGEFPIVIRVKLRSNGDYGVTASAPWPPQADELQGVGYATLCGYGAKMLNVGVTVPHFAGCKYPGTPGALTIPFLTNPTRCSGAEQVTGFVLDSYQRPAALDSEGRPLLSDPNWKLGEAKSPAITGCNQLFFEPRFEGRPTTGVADAPSGLDFDLHLPQNGLVEPSGRAEAHLRNSTVTLPEGLVVNPAAAAGLDACSSAQIGLSTPIGSTPVHFTGLAPQCPDAAKLGTVEVTTPLLDKPLDGSVYLAKQLDNPFGSLLALYLVIDDPETGVVVKLAGKVTPDPVTGRLTATFDENPQLPFEELQLHIFSGPQASLRTPSTCGPKSTLAELTPWSAPESGPPADLVDSFETTVAPGGGPCPRSASEEPNAPRFSAGTISPKAGSYSPFVMRLARDDGSQEIKGLDLTLPPGLSGRLAGVARCSEAEIARAQARSKPGDGASEQANPSCTAASEVGTVAVTAGAGPDPFHTGGRVYLAGPYKGAPVSLVVIAPAVAGPFDLGVVVIRNPLYINPKTAQVTVASDPIPTILEGVPLDLRSIEVKISRDRFTLNPTSCEPMAITGQATGASGSVANLRSSFQVGECSALGFRPGLRIQLHGGTRRGAYQRLTATVTYPQGSGYANIASAAVTLPHSEFLAQEHIRTVCTRVQFALHSCPAGSVYGYAEAETPLIDGKLAGPVYLRSSSNPLPDLVAALRGPDSTPVEVELDGRTDSVHGGIRNTFDLVPDTPVSAFTLRLLGGRKSLIVNSRDLCKGKKQRATARFTSQSGVQRNLRPVVGNDCGKPKHDRRGRRSNK
jgi:hypothetical protein